MKFVILCPFGVRTGGPEACLQLSDALLRSGFQAEIWWTQSQDFVAFQQYLANAEDTQSFLLEARRHEFDEYRNYKYVPFTSYSRSDTLTFIIPEVYISLVGLLCVKPIVVWWLSVDNAFGALAQVNMNLLRHPSIRHAVQSNYAKKFVNALGLNSSALSDYTVVPAKTKIQISAVDKRPLKLALNAGGKVVSDLDFLSQLIKKEVPQAEIIRIAGLTRAEVYDAFASARVFVDLGKFPGKDRMAREAILLGANIIVANSGAGAEKKDFAIEDIYRLNPFDYERLAKRAVHMLLHPAAHAKRFESVRAAVAAEKEEFRREAVELALA